MHKIFHRWDKNDHLSQYAWLQRVHKVWSCIQFAIHKLHTATLLPQPSPSEKQQLGQLLQPHLKKTTHVYNMKCIGIKIITIIQPCPSGQFSQDDANWKKQDKASLEYIKTAYITRLFRYSSSNKSILVISAKPYTKLFYLMCPLR